MKQQKMKPDQLRAEIIRLSDSGLKPKEIGQKLNIDPKKASQILWWHRSGNAAKPIYDTAPVKKRETKITIKQHKKIELPPPEPESHQAEITVDMEDLLPHKIEQRVQAIQAKIKIRLRPVSDAIDHDIPEKTFHKLCVVAVKNGKTFAQLLDEMIELFIMDEK